MNINPISVNKFFSTLKSLIWIGISSILFSGCYSYKNQILFQGLSDTTYSASMVQPKPIIQLGDQLSIMVYDLVSEEGTIEFPKLGTIKVLGYHQEQLRDSLQQWLTPWVKDPIVNVRLLNFRVTYLTTDRATTVMIMNNKTNIIQFLGMVGGITWTDRKDNVLVIRQIDGQRQIFQVDFTKKELFNSPVYYLQPNDIVYVEPNQRKFIESNVQLISLVTSITSTVSIFILFVNSLR